MASPFPFQPPPWLVEELQRRVVLLINHVLMQESEAQARLVRQAGKSVHAGWRSFSMRLQATPAGLFEVVPESATPADLTLTLTETSPWQLAQTALKGDKPPVHIAGDVQFAAEINWLVENVRWDLEEDVARVIGDAPAHAIGDVARRVLSAMREFVASATSVGAPPAAGPAATGGAGPGGTVSPGTGPNNP
jgi:ubiquinone biosynthesis protein UbiJ